MNHIYEYSENRARILLAAEKRDKCIIYCMRCARLFLSHKNYYDIITDNTKEDIIQDLYIVIIKAIDSFDESKQCKLFTWLFNNMEYHMIEYKRDWYKNKEYQFPDNWDREAEPERNWDEVDTRVCNVCNKELKINKCFDGGRRTCFKCRNRLKGPSRAQQEAS